MRPSQHPLITLMALSLALPFATACDDDEDGSSVTADSGSVDTDGGQEEPNDGGSEEPTDASQEEPTDAGQEEPTDASQEEPTDASTDASQEEPTDASTDAGQEEPTDASTDAGQEEPTDASTDAGQEEPTDASTDADTDAGTDANTDAGQEEPGEDDGELIEIANGSFESITREGVYANIQGWSTLETPRKREDGLYFSHLAGDAEADPIEGDRVGVFIGTTGQRVELSMEEEAAMMTAGEEYTLKVKVQPLLDNPAPVRFTAALNTYVYAEHIGSALWTLAHSDLTSFPEGEVQELVVTYKVQPQDVGAPLYVALGFEAGETGALTAGVSFDDVRLYRKQGDPLPADPAIVPNGDFSQPALGPGNATATHSGWFPGSDLYYSGIMTDLPAEQAAPEGGQVLEFASYSSEFSVLSSSFSLGAGFYRVQAYAAAAAGSAGPLDLELALGRTDANNRELPLRHSASLQLTEEWQRTEQCITVPAQAAPHTARIQFFGHTTAQSQLSQPLLANVKVEPITEAECDALPHWIEEAPAPEGYEWVNVPNGDFAAGARNWALDLLFGSFNSRAHYNGELQNDFKVVNGQVEELHHRRRNVGLIQAVSASTFTVASDLPIATMQAGERYVLNVRARAAAGYAQPKLFAAALSTRVQHNPALENYSTWDLAWSEPTALPQDDYVDLEVIHEVTPAEEGKPLYVRFAFESSEARTRVAIESVRVMRATQSAAPEPLTQTLNPAMDNIQLPEGGYYGSIYGWTLSEHAVFGATVRNDAAIMNPPPTGPQALEIDPGNIATLRAVPLELEAGRYQVQLHMAKRKDLRQPSKIDRWVEVINAQGELQRNLAEYDMQLTEAWQTYGGCLYLPEGEGPFQVAQSVYGLGGNLARVLISGYEIQPATAQDCPDP